MRLKNKSLPICLLFSISSVFSVFGQKTLGYYDADKEYEKGMELFKYEKYTEAKFHFKKAIDQYGELNSDVKTNAEFYSALCAIELFNDDAEYLISSFISKYPESPKAKLAYFEMGNFRYRQEFYNEAIYWYEKVDVNALDKLQRAEFYFKQGYSYFMEGLKEQASQSFFMIKDVDTEFTSPAIYYYAHIAYEEGNYETALNEFLRLEKDATFSTIVPYYIAQIFHLQERYDKVIEFAPGFIDEANTRRKPEIARIIGESYFRLKDYTNALKYLEIYDKNSKKRTREDMYQLAYAYYMLRSCDKAISLFEKVAGENDLLSQNSYYHLGDCYLQTGDKKKARLAFSAASKMEYDKFMQEDALFNYAKLSLHLKFTPFNDAVEAFQKYIELFPGTTRSEEAYNYLVISFLNTKNYKQALETLHKIKLDDSRLNEVYQKVTYFRGIELFNNLEFEEAIKLFNQSLEYSQYDQLVKAKTIYWLGEAHYRMKRYQEAIDHFENFLLQPGAYQSGQFYNAHYNNGYAYFRINDYNNALNWFRKYVNLYTDEKSLKIGDSYNRIADSYFVQRKYWQALENYQNSLKYYSPEPDYTLFQQGFTYGLVNRPKNKIKALSDLISQYPNSVYFDNALYELGRSYEKINENQLAINSYTKIVEEYSISSKVPKALLQLGLLHYNMDLLDQSLNYYKKLVTEYKSTDEAKFALTGIKNIYVDKNEVQTYFDFIKELGDTIYITVNEQDSLTFLAVENLFMSGDCNKSIQKLNDYIETFPKGNFLTEVHFYKADCELKSGNFDEALESYNFILSKPTNSFTEQSLLNAGKIFLKKENFEEAIDHFLLLEEITENKSNLYEARLLLMRTAQKTGNHELAISAANKLLSNDDLQKELKREVIYTKGINLYELNKLEDALDQFRLISDDIISEQGAEASYLTTKIYVEQNKLDMAQTEIMDFVSKNSPHVYWIGKSFILLADIYHKKEDNFQAKATLQSLIDNYPVANDSIIDEANNKLLEIIKTEKEEEFIKEEEDIQLKFEGNEEGKYDELFETKPASGDTFINARGDTIIM
ncbi:tetratricopeptide repeat protein [Bacteroidota bacterium]